ncbi:glycosyltransferase [Marinobacter koreensis]|nr:glycosyltransferase [Marinobacter koreensis]
MKVTLAATLSQPFTRVVVVDNHSSDGTGEWLDSQDDDRLIVLRLNRNSGGAGGFKVALQWLQRSRYTSDEWLVLFDDDAQPASGFVETLSRRASGGKCDVLVSAVYGTDGKPIEMNRALARVPRSFIDQFRFAFNRQHYVVSDYAHISRTEAASFVGLAIRADIALANLDLLREEFFIYFDDVFFTWGLTQRGYSGCFAPDLHFVHRVNFRRGQSINPPWKAYFYTRNMFPLYRAYSPVWFLVPVMMRLANVLLVAARQTGARKAILAHSVRGFWHGLTGNFAYNPLYKNTTKNEI